MPSTPASVIPLPKSGIVLEYKYHAPEHALQPGKNALAVLLHPWSRLGGTFNDPTLRAMIAPLRERGYHVLRYNARGVGNSSGSASWTGLPEAHDLEEFVLWALGNYPDIKSVLIVGYSFGSLTASLHPLLARVPTRHVLLSYPLSPRGALTLFRGSTYASALSRLLRAQGADVLVAYGTRDEFTSVAKYDRWASDLQKVVEDGGAAAKLEVAKIDGATHFWLSDAREKLVKVLEQWLDK